MTDSPLLPVARSSAALLFSQLTLSVVSLLNTVYLLRVLSREELAATALIDILIVLFGFTDLGLGTVAAQQAPSSLISTDRTRGLALIKTALIGQTIVMLLLAGGSLFIAPQLSSVFLKTPSYVWAAILAIPAAVLCNEFYLLLGIAQIAQDFYLTARWNLIGGVLRQTLPIVCLIAGGLPGFFVGTVVSFAIPVIGLLWSLRRLIFNSVRPAAFGPTLHYGIPFYLRTFLRFGFLRFDQAIVAIMLPPAVLASYTAARPLAKNIRILADVFQAPITVRMTSAQKDLPEAQATFFHKAVRYMALLNLPLALMLATASPWLMRLYAGPRYAADWPILAILTLTQAPYAFYIVYSSAVFALATPSVTLLLEGITGGANLLIGSALIALTGPYGVAFGQLISFSIGTAIAAWIVRPRAGFRFEIGSLRLILVPLLLGCTMIVAGQLFFPAWWSAGLCILAGGLVFVLLTSRQLSDQDWEQISKLIPTRLLPVMHYYQRFIHHAYKEDRRDEDRSKP
jgi:O-antigen/teichoic acid export membrane protein